MLNSLKKIDFCLDFWGRKIRVKELDDLKIKFSENITEQTKHFKEILENQEKKYNELYKKIESLLPGATSTGLAKAFEEKRKEFEQQTYFWNIVFIFSKVGAIL